MSLGHSGLLKPGTGTAWDFGNFFAYIDNEITASTAQNYLICWEHYLPISHYMLSSFFVYSIKMSQHFADIYCRFLHIYNDKTARRVSATQVPNTRCQEWFGHYCIKVITQWSSGYAPSLLCSRSRIWSQSEGPKNFQNWHSSAETQQPVYHMQNNAKGCLVLSFQCWGK